MELDRPPVRIESVTANTCAVTIITENGEVRIIASHSEIRIQSSNGVSILVFP